MSGREAEGGAADGGGGGKRFTEYTEHKIKNEVPGGTGCGSDEN